MNDVMRSHFLTSLFSCALLLSAAAALEAQTPSGDSDAAQAGAVLFRQTGCGHCHGADLAGTKKGPSLIGIKNDSKWPVEKMRDQILNGGKKMPSFADSLSDDEIAQVITYLRSSSQAAAAVASSGKK